LVTPPAEAVTVAVWSVVTAVNAAVNPALLDPAGTVTEPGTLTAVLVLDRLTASPPLPAAAVRVTVQASLPDPVNELVAQLSPLSVAAPLIPVPLRLTAAALGEALSLMLIAPLAVPETVGSKTTVREAV